MNITSYMKKEGRALPVFLLVDTSGSMSGSKIETVNVALKEMFVSLKKIENPKGIIHVCVLAFGNDKVEILKPLSKISDDDLFQLTASGNTPMGLAFAKVQEMIEDFNVVSSRAYTPTIVLISDGLPTDYKVSASSSREEIFRWPALNFLHSGPRSSKAIKMAMGIGDDADHNLLKAFINNDTIPVIQAKDNQTISKFFQWVTMSVSIRSVSANPNSASLPDTGFFNPNEMEF